MLDRLEIPSDCKSAVREPEARCDNVEHGHGEQNAPPEVHELVIAKTRKRSADPDVKTEETKDLAHEPEERERGVDEVALERSEEVAEGAGPAAKEEQRCDA